MYNLVIYLVNFNLLCYLVTDFNLYKIFVFNLNNFTFNFCLLFFIPLLYWRAESAYYFLIVFFISILQWPTMYFFEPVFLDTLSHGWVLFHPILFYLSLLLLSLLLSKKDCSLFFIFSGLNIYLLAITLVLGSFWGLVLNVWGFYWVYDPIEIVLLSLLLLCLAYSHLRPSTTRYTGYSVGYFLLYVILIRLGVVNTRHSFFNKSSSHFLNYIYIICIIQMLYSRLGSIRAYLHLNVTFILLLLLLLRVQVIFYLIWVYISYYILIALTSHARWSSRILLGHTILAYAYLYLLIKLVNYRYYKHHFSSTTYTNKLMYIKYTIFEYKYVYDLGRKVDLFRNAVNNSSNVVASTPLKLLEAPLFNNHYFLSQSTLNIISTLGYSIRSVFYDTKLFPWILTVDFDKTTPIG